MKAKKETSIAVAGFSQAFGVALYCTTIGLLMFNAEEIFDNVEPSQFIPVMMLLLFSFSALICGLLVFYKPYLLFFEGKKRQAADLVVFTAAWLFGFFLAAFLAVVFI